MEYVSPGYWQRCFHFIIQPFSNYSFPHLCHSLPHDPVCFVLRTYHVLEMPCLKVFTHPHIFFHPSHEIQSTEDQGLSITFIFICSWSNSTWNKISAPQILAGWINFHSHHSLGFLWRSHVLFPILWLFLSCYYKAFSHHIPATTIPPPTF